MTNNMKISHLGLALIKEYEGFRSSPYLCPAGVPTIGYGATFYQQNPIIKVTMRDPSISEPAATKLLLNTLKSFESAINDMVVVDLNQYQFDALVSLGFNIGTENLRRSTLLKKVNSGDISGAAPHFEQWNKARVKGVLIPLPGLTRRRKAERALFEMRA
jgi:lysozyme